MFQRTLSRILDGLDVICHMDIILIHGPTQEVHDQRVQRVLKRLQEAGIALTEKCEFSKKEITFFGHVISLDGTEISCTYECY